jgi:hypothetical protein
MLNRTTMTTTMIVTRTSLLVVRSLGLRFTILATHRIKFKDCWTEPGGEFATVLGVLIVVTLLETRLARVVKNPMLHPRPSPAVVLLLGVMTPRPVCWKTHEQTHQPLLPVSAVSCIYGRMDSLLTMVPYTVMMIPRMQIPCE